MLTRPSKSLFPFLGYSLMFVIVVSALFALDVAVDYFVARIDGSYARSIEKKRECDEDDKQIAEARRMRYESFQFPNLYNHDEQFKELAIRHGIAPLGGLPMTSTYYCNEGYGQVRYTSDRYGFRNSDRLWDSARVQVMLIGDSYAQGACVNQDETITANLNAKGVVSLNLGMGDNGPIQYAAVAKTFIKIKKVENVVVVFYANDNLPSERDDIYHKIFFANDPVYFSTDGQAGPPPLSRNLINLYAEARELPSASRQKLDELSLVRLKRCVAMSENWARIKSSLKFHLSLSGMRKLVKLYRSKPKPGQLMEQLPFGSKLVVDVVGAECARTGCNPIFLYIPNSEFWRPDFRARQYASLLKTYVEDQKMVFVDTTEALHRLGDSAYALKGPHLSPAGYNAVADKILETIDR